MIKNTVEIIRMKFAKHLALHGLLFCLLISQILIYFYLLVHWNNSIGIRFSLVATQLLLIASLWLAIVYKKTPPSASTHINKKFTLKAFFAFIMNGITEWNNSTSNHFCHLDQRLCLSVGIALILFAGTYFLIPYNPQTLQIFLPEQVDLYGIIDSFPQRAAYEVFLCFIIGSSFIIGLLSKNNSDHFVIKKSSSAMFGILILISAVVSVWTSSLDVRAWMVLLITIIVALTAYYARLRWIAWAFIAILIISALLPGWLHTPEPVASALKGFDQHYDMVMYRGRQLAAGHLFSIDSPPYYSMLWSSLIGIIAKEIQIPTFAMLIRITQAGQVLCLVAFALAGWLRIRCQSSRAVAMTFLAVAVVPWLSTDGFAVWYPNQSGLRFLMVPVAICFVLLINRTSTIWAGGIAGGVSGFALIANFETGVVATAGLGMAWLVQLRHQPLRAWVTSAISGMVALFSVFLMLALSYRYFFKAWPFPTDIKSLASFFLLFTGGFGGLALPLRSLVIVIMAHASYKFMQSMQCIFDRKSIAPDAMTSAIATMLLVWFPYYINRPDDWNLWTFIALYSLLLIPMFTKGYQSMVPFVIGSLILLPIAAKNLPYFVIDPLYSNQWRSGFQPGCAGGLVLPADYCSHLQERAKTLRNLASQGSIAWSTSIPVLTDQTANTPGPFWTGNLFGLSLTNSNFNNLIQKIKDKKIDFLLFDDPADSFIQPRLPETSFNQKLLATLQNDYCNPQLIGGWLVAKRNQNGHC
ncbi:hypothetical protein [Aquicella lusitana]|uniref:Uncharacterized protein n=1 Tax=Aquicella lusitana TaxID=254246 RepID=A0A370GWS7_9COXI|nr:hypothetical protein [Aquicella lusitana]RDI48135.1 hypothetical protein C8D86_103100 [Aquicella lusitana]VVC72849.1 hypothetical protein AQULUS_05730 [Aquicella lusitana]